MITNSSFALLHGPSLDPNVLHHHVHLTRPGTGLKLELYSCLHTRPGVGAQADSIPRGCWSETTQHLSSLETTSIAVTNTSLPPSPTPLGPAASIFQAAPVTSPTLPYLTLASHTPSCRCPGQVRTGQYGVLSSLTLHIRTLAHAYLPACLLYTLRTRAYLTWDTCGHPSIHPTVHSQSSPHPLIHHFMPGLTYV